MTAKITYLGGKETGDVGRVAWGDYEFELNKAVEVTDPHIVQKAKNNKFFKVVDSNGTPSPAPDDDDDDDDKDDDDKASKAKPPSGTTSATRTPARSR